MNEPVLFIYRKEGGRKSEQSKKSEIFIPSDVAAYPRRQPDATFTSLSTVMIRVRKPCIDISERG